MGGGLFIGGQPNLHPKGAGSQRFPIFGVSFYLSTLTMMQNYKISRGNTYGEGIVFRLSATPPPQRAGSQRSPIWGLFSIYA